MQLYYANIVNYIRCADWFHYLCNLINLYNNIQEEILANPQYNTEFSQLSNKLYTGDEREADAKRNEIKRMFYYFE